VLEHPAALQTTPLHDSDTACYTAAIFETVMCHAREADHLVAFLTPLQLRRLLLSVTSPASPSIHRRLAPWHRAPRHRMTSRVTTPNAIARRDEQHRAAPSASRPGSIAPPPNHGSTAPRVT